MIDRTSVLFVTQLAQTAIYVDRRRPDGLEHTRNIVAGVSLVLFRAFEDR